MYIQTYVYASLWGNFQTAKSVGTISQSVGAVSLYERSMCTRRRETPLMVLSLDDDYVSSAAAAVFVPIIRSF